MVLNEAKQIIRSAASSRLHEYPPESMVRLLEAARVVLRELEKKEANG